jgi:dTDP-4-amino-4,6-dideoxygalactose transaminase
MISEMRSSETNIIGGMFGLELFAMEENSGKAYEPPFLAGPHLLLATARSAFTLLARILRPKTVWLPSYLCEVLMGAFPVHLMEVRFYPIDEQLRIAEEDWLSEIQANDIVLFIDYFGFNQWADWGAEARRRGAWVVQDAAQALLSEHFNKHSHYVVFSPRKFVGIPEGGVLLALNGAELPNEDLASSPALWWMEATKASILRAEYDRHGGERRWFDIFQKTEAEGPLEPFRMSDLSLLILKNAVDWRKVSQRRRDNYKFLASELGQIALFPELTSDVVPLGFPVRLKDRDRIRQTLFAEKIYPQVHWSIAGVVPPAFEAGHRLAAEIMTLPCDQRYNQSDMERVVSQLRRFSKIS